MLFTELPHKALILVCKIAQELEKESGEKINLSDENLFAILKDKIRESSNLKALKLFHEVEKLVS